MKHPKLSTASSQHCKTLLQNKNHSKDSINYVNTARKPTPKQSNMAKKEGRKELEKRKPDEADLARNWPNERRKCLVPVVLVEKVARRGFLFGSKWFFEEGRSDVSFSVQRARKFEYTEMSLR